MAPFFDNSRSSKIQAKFGLLVFYTALLELLLGVCLTRFALNSNDLPFCLKQTSSKTQATCLTHSTLHISHLTEALRYFPPSSWRDRDIKTTTETQRRAPENSAALDPFVATGKIMGTNSEAELRAIYVTTLEKLTPKQRAFVEFYNDDPECMGNVQKASDKAQYASASARDFYALIPSHSEAVEISDELHPVTLAVLIGMRIKAEVFSRSERKKSHQRIRLGITPDYVLKRLKEIAERAAGYDFDKDTGERVGEFKEKNFQPSAAARTFRLLGQEQGMFSDAGPGRDAPKEIGAMEEAELDDEQRKLGEKLVEVERRLADQRAKATGDGDGEA